MITGNMIGLALSGGGAWGSAHDGVLDYLYKIGIPIDFVGGVSIGSEAGGSYW
jgi:NTE family protein